MSLLHGITGKKPALAISTLGRTADAAIGEQEAGQMNVLAQSLDMATARLGKLLDVSEAVDAIQPEGKSAIQMTRVMLASSLTDLAMTDEDALTATIGVESEGADIGNEAFSTVKEYAVKIIEWIQKKWKEFKTFVAKYFNKFFGDVERLKKSWVGVLESAKEKQADFTLEKNAKYEFEKGADAFFTGETALKGEDLAAEAKRYAEISEVLNEKILPYDVVELNESNLLTNEGKEIVTSAEFNKIVKLGNLVVNFAKILKVSDISKGPAKFASENGSRSAALAGRVALYGTMKTSPEDTLDSLKSVKIGLGDLTDEQKVKTKVSMDLVTASVVETMADANIELIDSIINLKRSKRMDAVDVQLDKASKALDAWKKAAPDASESAEVRAAFRGAVKVATEYFSVSRRILVGFPLEFCGQAKMISSMHKVFANKSLSAMKKDA